MSPTTQSYTVENTIRHVGHRVVCYHCWLHLAEVIYGYLMMVTTDGVESAAKVAEKDDRAGDAGAGSGEERQVLLTYPSHLLLPLHVITFLLVHFLHNLLYSGASDEGPSEIGVTSLLGCWPHSVPCLEVPLYKLPATVGPTIEDTPTKKNTCLLGSHLYIPIRWNE